MLWFTLYIVAAVMAIAKTCLNYRVRTNSLTRTKSAYIAHVLYGLLWPWMLVQAAIAGYKEWRNPIGYFEFGLTIPESKAVFPKMLTSEQRNQVNELKKVQPIPETLNIPFGLSIRKPTTNQDKIFMLWFDDYFESSRNPSQLPMLILMEAEWLLKGELPERETIFEFEDFKQACFVSPIFWNHWFERIAPLMYKEDFEQNESGNLLAVTKEVNDMAMLNLEYCSNPDEYILPQLILEYESFNEN